MHATQGNAKAPADSMSSSEPPSQAVLASAISAVLRLCLQDAEDACTQGSSSCSSCPLPASAAQPSSMTPALAAHAREVLLQLQALSEQAAVSRPGSVAMARSGGAAVGAGTGTVQPRAPTPPPSLWTLLPKLAQKAQAAVLHLCPPLRPSDAVESALCTPAPTTGDAGQEAGPQLPQPRRGRQARVHSVRHAASGTVRTSSPVQAVGTACRQSRTFLRPSVGRKRRRSKPRGARLLANASQPASLLSSSSISRHSAGHDFAACPSQPLCVSSQPARAMSSSQHLAVPALPASEHTASLATPDAAYVSDVSNDTVRTAISSLTSPSPPSPPRQVPPRPVRSPTAGTSRAVQSLGVTPRVSILAGTGQSTFTVPPELPSMTTMNLPPLHSLPPADAASSATPSGSSPSRGWLTSMLGVFGARLA